MAKQAAKPRNDAVRIGAAAEMLGVSPDTVRRWSAAGKIRTRRSRGGQRLIALADVTRLAGAKRAKTKPATQSARNRFEGIITRVEKDRVAALIEIRAGPHRLVSLITADAATELGLEVGMPAVAVVKATNVMIELI